MKLRDYKFGFNISALILIAIILLPNIIWGFVPAQNDILRAESSAPVLDAFATVFQVILLAALCILRNKNTEKLNFSVFLILCAATCALYVICWITYYCGLVHITLIIGLCVFPCISFAFFATDRKNYIALIPIAIFTVLHFTSTAVNFF